MNPPKIKICNKNKSSNYEYNYNLTVGGKTCYVNIEQINTPVFPTHSYANHRTNIIRSACVNKVPISFNSTIILFGVWVVCEDQFFNVLIEETKIINCENMHTQ